MTGAFRTWRGHRQLSAGWRCYLTAKPGGTKGRFADELKSELKGPSHRCGRMAVRGLRAALVGLLPEDRLEAKSGTT